MYDWGGGLNRFYVITTLALSSAVVQKHISYSVRVKDFLLIDASKHQTYKSRKLRWNKMSTQQQDQYWNAGATEIQQLNPGGPNQRQSIEPQPNWL